MTEYKYLRGGRDSYEAVEFDITKGERYITTCVVNIDLLICGIKTAPCGNGNDVKLTPEQQLAILELVQAERKKITDRDTVKTLQGWRDSGLCSLELYLFPGDTVDGEFVEYFVDLLPPRNMRSTCTQIGEPFSHEKDEDGRYRATYDTFHRLSDGLWQFDGHCFAGENKNRFTGKSRLEERIDEARREVERNGD